MAGGPVSDNGEESNASTLEQSVFTIAVAAAAAEFSQSISWCEQRSAEDVESPSHVIAKLQLFILIHIRWFSKRCRKIIIFDKIITQITAQNYFPAVTVMSMCNRFYCQFYYFCIHIIRLTLKGRSENYGCTPFQLNESCIVCVKHFIAIIIKNETMFFWCQTIIVITTCSCQSNN